MLVQFNSVFKTDDLDDIKYRKNKITRQLVFDFLSEAILNDTSVYSVVCIKHKSNGTIIISKKNGSIERLMFYFPEISGRMAMYSNIIDYLAAISVQRMTYERIDYAYSKKVIGI